MLQWIRKNHLFAMKAALIGFLFLAVFLVFSDNSVAQTGNPSSSLQEGVQVIQQPLGLPATDIRVIVVKIIKGALGLLGIISVVIIVYAGFLWMTAGGNEEQIGKAKKMLLNAVIGLIIILSAYGIVAFVARMLGIGVNNGNNGAGGPTLGAPAPQNFNGSGALGGIIKDHYPRRDQEGVPRNTKIVVTFRKPLQVSSFIEDTFNDGILGDCKPVVENWVTDCDQVKMTDGKLSDSFINIKNSDTGESIKAVAVIAASSTVDNISGIYTIVLKPITDLGLASGGYLGSNTVPVNYTVHLGPEMRLDDPANSNPSVFQQKVLGNNFYEWKFTNSTALDTKPPYVTDVFPGIGAKETKNSVIQVNFSEPVDPTGIQGVFGSNDELYYTLEGENIFLKSKQSSLPLGSFNLTNGYQTLEFAPSQECGRNACGNKIYCLPVCDEPGANCKQDDYELLLKAARVINVGTFEAQPLSGLMDLAGNALDGKKDNVPQQASNVPPVFPNQKQPDNYFWNFTIIDQIDASAPYLQEITPGKDAEYVPPNQEWSMTFSKRMRADSMYTIALDEFPAPEVPLWKVPFSKFNESGTTYTRIDHGNFLDSVREYYFPIVTSTVEDVHFNCFYPGEGPSQTANQTTLESEICNEQNKENCCLTHAAENEDFCCNGEPAESSVSACLSSWKSQSL